MKKTVILTLFVLLISLPLAVPAQWVSLSGIGLDIAVNDDTVWVIGSTHAIWSKSSTTRSFGWNSSSGNNWIEYPGHGKAIAIAVGYDNRPWVIGTDNMVYRGTGSGWEKVGAGQGQNSRWSTSFPSMGQGEDMYPERNRHEEMYAYDIAVDRHNMPWIIGKDNRVYYYDHSGWREYPGGGRGKAIAVSHEGVPYVIGISNQIYKGVGSGWVELSGGGRGVDIAVSKLGTPWIIGMDRGIYYHNGNGWKKTTDGTGVKISTGQRNTPYVVGTEGTIFFSTEHYY